ncbi:hypothetical protein BJX70DRAFT_384670 [Aspergillus crustosus]
MVDWANSRQNLESSASPPLGGPRCLYYHECIIDQIVTIPFASISFASICVSLTRTTILIVS